MSRVTKRQNTKNRSARINAVKSYYKNFRNGNNRHNKTS